MQKIHMSDQYAPNSVTVREEFVDFRTPVIESALHHANLKKLAARTESNGGVSLCELPLTGLLVLRAKSDKAALQAALQSTLNLDLPETLGCTANSNNTGPLKPCVRWVAPDEWMLSCPVEEAFGIENKLRSSLTDKSVAIVNVTGGYTVLHLSGPNAYDVLKKSTTYDVHPSHFSAGKVVNTVLAKAQVTMRCIEMNEYELIVRRSFADYLWHWIQVVSIEYGLSISTTD